MYDDASKTPTGPLDFFDDFGALGLSEELVEKWWCIGDVRNRAGLWIQGQKRFAQT